jgi:uncharacterized membrane protein (UPF0182 family)
MRTSPIQAPVGPTVAYLRIDLQAIAAMPADLRAHTRYRGDLFSPSDAFYATYHMVEPDAFYHREDQWQYPDVDRTRSQRRTFMRTSS